MGKSPMFFAASRLSRFRRTAAVLGAVAALAACSGDITGVPETPAAKGPIQPAGSDSPPPPPPPPPQPSVTNPLAGASFYVDANSSARKTADAWRASRPGDAMAMDKIASQPQARWIGNWNADVFAATNEAVTKMTLAGAVPVLVAYNIPQRDCGGLSGDNNTTVDAYRSWITAFANGIGDRRAIVILEPDALAAMDCLSAPDQQTRLELLRFGVQTLKAQGRVAVYIDAGNPRWHSASSIALRLRTAGLDDAAGFSLNVSNFIGTDDNIAYGQQISAMTGGTHFIIDTGRNGLGPTTDFQWCNPAGRAIGSRPTTDTHIPHLDAFLWIKTPGESDGACNGAPVSGTWMPEYALEMAKLATY